MNQLQIEPLIHPESQLANCCGALAEISALAENCFAKHMPAQEFDPEMLRLLFDAVLDFLTACQAQRLQHIVRELDSGPFGGAIRRRHYRRVIARNTHLGDEQVDQLLDFATRAKDDFDWQRLQQLQAQL